jgi:uncharacterized membrane protein
MFEFVLFVILGWMVFAPPANPNGRVVLMVVFVVLLILWVLVGVGAFKIPYGGHAWG